MSQAEATYCEVGLPPTAQDQGYDMENNYCYRSARVIPRKNASVNLREYNIESEKVNAESFDIEDNSGSDGNREKGTKSQNKCVMAAIVIVAMLVLAVAACCIAFILEFSELKSSATQEQNLSSLTNINDQLEILLNSSVETIHLQYLQDIDTLTQELNISLSNKIESIEITFLEQLKNEYERLSALQNDTKQFITGLERSGLHHIFPATSCAALHPSSPSGYYWVRASNGSAVHVYCDMTRSCGSFTGGWIRVAELDMSSSSSQCPSGFRERNDSNIRTCVTMSSSSGCSSINISTLGINYTSVCGRIIGYQIGHTNAFSTQSNNINSFYVDGIVLTYGSPKQHVWTFAAARDENDNSLGSNCPCVLRNGFGPPGFVGNDYFCDTGSDNGQVVDGLFYGDDPLWDGAGCGPTSTCCSFNTPPWFFKQLSQPTTDHLEMRVCKNEDNTEEDVAIEVVEVYIQ